MPRYARQTPLHARYLHSIARRLSGRMCRAFTLYSKAPRNPARSPIEVSFRPYRKAHRTSEGDHESGWGILHYKQSGSTTAENHFDLQRAALRMYPRAKLFALYTKIRILDIDGTGGLTRILIGTLRAGPVIPPFSAFSSLVERSFAPFRLMHLVMYFS